MAETSSTSAVKQATEAVSRTSEAVSRTAAHVRNELEGTDERVRAFVQEYPLTSFFAALATGYLVARLVNRL